MKPKVAHLRQIASLHSILEVSVSLHSILKINTFLIPRGFKTCLFLGLNVKTCLCLGLNVKTCLLLGLRWPPGYEFGYVNNGVNSISRLAPFEFLARKNMSEKHLKESI